MQLGLASVDGRVSWDGCYCYVVARLSSHFADENVAEALGIIGNVAEASGIIEIQSARKQILIAY